MATGVLGWSARLLLVLVVGGCNCGAPDPEVGPPSSESSSGVAPRRGTEEPHEPVPASPQLRWPHNGAETGSPHAPQPDEVHSSSLRPRFLWNPVESASRYEIEVEDDCVTADRESCAFDSAELRESVETTTFRPGAPLPVSTQAPVGRRYFWRVRACNAGGCSDWSSVRYFDVGRAASDFNGDGYADLVLARLGGGPFPADNVSGYEVAFGSAEGIQRRPPSQLRPVAGCRVDSLDRFQHARDIDGDGFDDLGIRLEPRDELNLGFLFGGAEGFARCERPEEFQGYGFLVLDNLAESGEVSVLACGPERSFWSWRRGSLVRIPPLTTPDACVAETSLDLDSDGTTDLLSSGTEGIRVFRSGPTGLEADPSDLPFYWQLHEGCAGDFDGDGYIDLLVPTSREVHRTPSSPEIDGRQESMIVWGPITASGGHSSLEWPSDVTADARSSLLFAATACGDFDGDGRTDVVRRVDGGENPELLGAQWFRWNGQREMSQVDLADRLGRGFPQSGLDVDGDGADELILFVDYHHSSEIRVLHDLASSERTRLRYDRGARLVHTVQR